MCESRAFPWTGPRVRFVVGSSLCAVRSAMMMGLASLGLAARRVRGRPWQRKGLRAAAEMEAMRVQPAPSTPPYRAYCQTLSRTPRPRRQRLGHQRSYVVVPLSWVLVEFAWLPFRWRCSWTLGDDPRSRLGIATSTRSTGLCDGCEEPETTG